MMSFESQLTDGRERFLAHAVDHALMNGRRSFEDFLRRFGPTQIMEALADHPTLRANILVLSTGVRPKIAARKSPASCSEDLQIALEEGEADAETVVTLFDPDDRVRYLAAGALWRFLAEAEPWTVSEDDADAHALVAEHFGYLLQRALDEDLITHRDMVEAITVEELARRLPRTELAHIVQTALSAGVEERGFSEEDLINTTPCDVIARSVPLPTLWERVIVAKIAEPAGFLDAEEEDEEVDVSSTPSLRVSPLELMELDEPGVPPRRPSQEPVPLTRRRSAPPTPASASATGAPPPPTAAAPRKTSVPPPLPHKRPAPTPALTLVGT